MAEAWVVLAICQAASQQEKDQTRPGQTQHTPKEPNRIQREPGTEATLPSKEIKPLDLHFSQFERISGAMCNKAIYQDGKIPTGRACVLGFSVHTLVVGRKGEVGGAHEKRAF
ncbi:hypothetical protein HYFRA_00005359 [Hymenoscyphus fraxineus]|uniref:Uncharacterized protein n=1 Tax=Hymenoscyphus fraxineus TaxID=746836 RepID=A0A9N9LAY9_9HELO|nr:hypothetical protein HYFRA_00005359 [Hymenoscyphus fraxineus]